MGHGLIPALALLAWVPFTYWLLQNHPVPKAATYALMGAALFLPNQVAFDLPLIPPLDKESLPPLVFLVFALFLSPAAVRRAKLGTGPELLFLLVLIGSIGTWYFNRNAIYISGWLQSHVLPGMGPRDTLFIVNSNLLRFILPFCAARVAVQSLADFRSVMRTIVILGLVYAIFVLIEVRMSPQIHAWVYGYPGPTQNFSQAMRWGGYRPSVFFPHGLGLAMFLLAVLLLLAGLYKAKKRLFGMSVRWFFFGYCVILVLEKSTGAIAYAALFLPVLLFAPVMLQRWSIIAVAALGLAYPVLIDVLPRHELVDAITAYSPERASSLAFRFDNEDILVERANKKFWVGWGSFGRNRVFDPDTGLDVAVTDGEWIIRFGTQGMFGMATVFLLLIVPVTQLMRQLKRHRLGREQHLMLGAAMYIALASADLILNGLLSYYIPFFFAGSVAGLARHLRALPPIRAGKRHRAQL